MGYKHCMYYSPRRLYKSLPWTLSGVLCLKLHCVVSVHDLCDLDQRARLAHSTPILIPYMECCCIFSFTSQRPQVGVQIYWRIGCSKLFQLWFFYLLLFSLKVPLRSEFSSCFLFPMSTICDITNQSEASWSSIQQRDTKNGVNRAGWGVSCPAGQLETQ